MLGRSLTSAPGFTTFSAFAGRERFKAGFFRGIEDRMEAYAVVETGGKQYLVKQNSELEVEKLAGEAGTSITLDRVLAVSDGQQLKVGAPVIAGAAVIATVVEQFRGEKTVSFKKKRRKGYHKKIGHRQSLTRLTVTEIKAG
jgi:large subunit ribosomal protein L21